MSDIFVILRLDRYSPDLGILGIQIRGNYVLRKCLSFCVNEVRGLNTRNKAFNFGSRFCFCHFYGFPPDDVFVGMFSSYLVDCSLLQEWMVYPGSRSTWDNSNSSQVLRSRTPYKCCYRLEIGIETEYFIRFWARLKSAWIIKLNVRPMMLSVMLIRKVRRQLFNQIRLQTKMLW